MMAPKEPSGLLKNAVFLHLLRAARRAAGFFSELSRRLFSAFRSRKEQVAEKLVFQQPASATDQRAVLLMVWLSAFSTPLMLSAANVALPSMAHDLHLNAVALSWVPLAYLLASAMFVLVCGRLADMRGRKRVFLVGTLGVVLSSALAAWAPNGAWLLAGRFAQGVFTAALYATQMAIVSSVFPPARRGQAIGLTISAVYLGLTAGPALGGWLLEASNWRACLLVQLPFSIAILSIGFSRIKGDWKNEEAQRLDVTGTALYMFALAAMLGGASLIPTALGWSLAAAGGLAAVAFVFVERKVSDPIFDLNLFFSNRVFGLSCLAAFLMYTATYANIVLVALYLQYLRALPPGKAGIIMMAQPLAMALFSPLAGRLSDRVEPRLLASAGMALTVAGLLALAMLTAQSPIALLVAALALTGLGFGLFSAPNANAIMGSVDKRHYGAANSKVATMRLLGQMCSMGIIALAFALLLGPVAITPQRYPALAQAIRLSYLIAVALCLPAIFFSLARGTVHAAKRASG
jgi:EmrB/QacA subfamily drug resistance transporter